MSIEITLQAGEKEAPFVYFEQTILDQAKAVDASDKNAVESFKKELIGIRKAKDQQLKTAIKTDLIHLKEKQTALLASFISERDEALAKAADDFAKISNPTKKNKQDYSDIEKGIEISAKRSASKAKSKYVKNIQLIKRKRSELYAEYLRVLAIRGVKESGADRLNERYLEAYGRFNLKASLSNKKFWIDKVPLFMLILIIAAYYIGKTITGYSGSLGDVINNGIFVAVVATGAVFIYSQGGFDMSLGNASLRCAVIAAILYNATNNRVVSLLVAIVLGAALGIVNAILATRLNLPVMVRTLTRRNILAAISDAIFEKYGGLITVNTGRFTNAWVYASFLVIFFILCWFIFNYTKVGRRNKFIGSNKKAAKFNGINLRKSGRISFALSGIGLGICGFLFACSKTGHQFGASTVLSQVGLNVVIAIVFGGRTTSGGPKSKVSCAIIGAFFSVFLDEFFAAISTPTFQVGDYCYRFKGLIFLIVSLANRWDTRGKMLASGGSIQ